MSSKNPKELTPEECFVYGQKIAREISDAYYQKHGHVKISDQIVHHYNLLWTVPFIQDNCLKAFVAGAALDDLPDLLDDLFQESDFVKKLSDSIREFRGEDIRHS